MRLFGNGTFTHTRFVGPANPLTKSWPNASRTWLRRLEFGTLFFVEMYLVPCWDVERCLSVQIEQQWDRELQGNDVYDIAALTAAIPYCDVVVTEKLWAHLCKASGVDA